VDGAGCSIMVVGMNINKITKFVDEKWKMKDGRTIMVNDMTESHAKNCLRMMIRQRNQCSCNDYDYVELDDDWGDKS
jgi:ABC-type sugar transport system ATPase subunit